MEVSIKAKEPFWWFTKGKHIEVTVRCTDEESRAIHAYDLLNVPIIDAEPTSDSEEGERFLRIRTFDSVYRFKDLCSNRSWHAHSDDDARRFVRALEEGFLRFHKLLDQKLREQAGSPTIVSLDNTVQDLLYEELVRKPQRSE